MSVQQVSAALLYIDPPQSELNRGDAVKLSVRLDTDESVQECVNAVDAVISYSANIAPVDISLGESIFSIWVEEPVINKENRTITFAGGIPNGYCGRVQGDPRLTNKLATIIFRSPGFSIGSGSSDDAEARVDFNPETTAYLNDGQGTAATLSTYGARMTLSKTAGSEIIDPWNDEVDLDTIPPEEFSIMLEKGGLEFTGRYYIIFNTQDKQTGIDQYQVMEQPLAEFGTFVWGRADAPWLEARSPYVLKDQSLNSIIRVKAIDKAGNEYVATLIPDESMRGLSADDIYTYLLFGALIFLVLIIIVAIITAIKMRRRKKLLEESTVISTEDSVEETDANQTAV